MKPFRMQRLKLLFQKIKIPSFNMRFLKRGFRFWWLRIISTGVPVSFSKNSLASISKNGLAVSVSTNKSISLPSFCSPLAVEPKRDKDVIPYLSKHNLPMRQIIGEIFGRYAF